MNATHCNKNVKKCRLDEGYVPIPCDLRIKQAMQGRDQNNAHTAYPQMPLVTGVLAGNATYEDFQREFYCKRIQSQFCRDKGLQFPRFCSHPPCDQCTVDYRSKLDYILSKISYIIIISNDR